MKILIVHAHPEPRSFCSAMKDVAVTVLEAGGHDVVVSDLYAMGFKAVADGADFDERRDPGYLNYALEQRSNYKGSTIAPDIAAEIDKVLACDLMIFNAPVFWFSVPAILKGWIDRVFVSGAFYGGRRFYDRGSLVGKKALVTMTLGGRDHMFGEGAIHGDIEGMLRHVLQGTLSYVGFDVLKPYFTYHVPYVTDEARAAMLEDYRVYVSNIDAAPILSFPSLDDFDDTMRPLNKHG